MENILNLQQILGVDKRNPVFTIFREPERKRFHVYYGHELLEKVPADKNHPEFKLLVALLYNAGVKATALQEAFGVDSKTMKRWGKALKSGDGELLARVLAGRSWHKKLTPEIEGFIRKRFKKIYGETRYDYSKRIREEIYETYEVDLSRETIRPLLKELKEEQTKETKGSQGELESKKRETACDYGETNRGEGRGNAEVCLEEREERGSKAVEGEAVDNCKESPKNRELGIVQGKLCHHVGVLLFSEILVKVEERIKDWGWLLKQWVAAILLGAVNIEQTKFLDFEDLEELLGRTLRFAHPQRVELNKVSRPEVVEALIGENAEQVSARGYRDFYYDPHTKRYTGMQKVLKGWCPRNRLADKVIHMDFIHTAEGHPVYIEHADNYEDLRARFMKTTEAFRRVVGIEEEEALTLIMDRGIYSYEVFEGFIESPRHHVITWEKDYKEVLWDEEEETGRFVVERSRNRAADKQAYMFSYKDESWEKKEGMRRIRVQATNPQGRMVQLGILTDDEKRPATEVIPLMFRRWTQENDFKYLDNHFGINQITSYASTPYKRLKEHIEERQMKSGEYKALEKERQEAQARLGNLLVQERHYPGKSKKRTRQIETLDKEYKQIKEEMKKTKKEVSRLEYVIEQDFVRLDTINKRTMDMLKLIARNAFYNLLQPFKEMYDNYRDDHAVFRNLTQAHGVLIEQADETEVILFPTVNYTPKVRGIVERFLNKMNEMVLLAPDGSGRRVRFRLGKKSGIKLAV